MAVMEEAIEHGRNGGAVAEQFAPVVQLLRNPEWGPK
jgi:hypothetical protein